MGREGGGPEEAEGRNPGTLGSCVERRRGERGAGVVRWSQSRFGLPMDLDSDKCKPIKELAIRRVTHLHFSKSIK